MTTVYRPRLINQLDGSRFAGLNCTCASAATAIDRHTLGHITCTGAKMRNHTGDTSGGTNLDNIDHGWHVGHGQDLDTRRKMPWSDFLSMINGGRGAVLQLWYGNLGNYRFQKDFSGNHAVYVNNLGVMRDSQGDVVPCAAMYDPLGNGVRNVPLVVLKSAAAHLRLGSGRTVGNGYCYAGFTRRVGMSTGTTVPVHAPGSFPTLYLGKPPAPPEVNPMIPGSGLVRTSSHIMSLKKGQPVYRTPGGPVATRMSADAKVEYFGNAGGVWRCIEISTGAPYLDKIARPTLVYVPAAAGPITKKP